MKSVGVYIRAQRAIIKAADNNDISQLNAAKYVRPMNEKRGRGQIRATLSRSFFIRAMINRARLSITPGDKWRCNRDTINFCRIIRG